MLKANLRVGQLTFQFEAPSQKEMFKAIAATQEIFAEDACGACQSTKIRYVVREVKGDFYHEIQCTECGSKLAFGQSKVKQGELFPIRKLVTEGPEKGKPDRKKGVYDNENHGWTKWRGKEPVDVE